MEKQTSEEIVPVSSDECGHSGGYPDSDEDIVTNYHISGLDMLQRTGPLPTISVTPHSPTYKIYPVLEDNLQQLRELHESIQHMRYSTVQDTRTSNLKNGVFTINPILAATSRFSTSCPSLSDTVLDMDVLGGSVGSSPLHQPTSTKGSAVQDWLCYPEVYRRRSWSAIEDLTTCDKTKYCRQRSISLSSMESEADESSLIDTVDNGPTNMLDKGNSVLKQRNSRNSNGAVSTHSLNEADFQEDFCVIKSKREVETRTLSQRLPLQKSISTPSILAVRELAPEPIFSAVHTTSSTYEGHSEKRRKRGSLFFRKKKSKNKKASHQWVSACYGSSHICDVCNKELNNKPSIYCECCGATVHQSPCKENVSECGRLKSSRQNSKSSRSSISSSKGYMKRGSACFDANGVSTNSQLLCDDRDDLHHGHNDAVSYGDDIPLIPSEFLSDSPVTAADLSSYICLELHENEPDSWTPRVGKEVVKKLKDKEVKRQEHIYEFILTEKHHCITLLLVQKIFVEGLQKYFQLGTTLERMFPRLSDLIELHLEFLTRLRQRQRENAVVSTIADILEEQFSDQNAQKLKSAYGEFCSKHRDAVEIYKDYLHSDPRFEQFVRHCQSNPLLKKKGIPECILFITQRLTKYPLLIEPLIKTSKENKKEQEALQRTLNFVKDILVDVDAQVAEKEKEDRKLEIYNRIDAKSYTVYRGLKFKKSDILQNNRSLKFEGTAMLMQGRSKMQLVLVIVLSDILFFLQESSHKYVFFNPDNKAGVVSLQKLLVREKAGQDSRGIYLISSNTADPEMFELKVHKPKDKQIWIHAIREAVQTCPEEEDNTILLNLEDNGSSGSVHSHIRHLIGLLRQKDVEQALLFEEKMTLQLKLLGVLGLDPPSPPSYSHLVAENVDPGQIWKEVLRAVQEVNRLTSSLYAPGTSLYRSVSSVGEHHSEAYVSPILPKRAETFGGFDSSNQYISKLKSQSVNTATSRSPMEKSDRIFSVANLLRKAGSAVTENDLRDKQLTAGEPVQDYNEQQQQCNAIQISHYVHTLICIISQLMTSNESYQAQINTLKSSSEGSRQYRHNQQLEELRNLQDKLSAEKSAWNSMRDQEAKELEEKRTELLKLQEQIKTEQEDIKSQREQMFRTMEKLTSKGIIISPNVATISLPGQLDDSAKDITDDCLRPEICTNMSSTVERKKDKRSKNSLTKTQLPINLISATNQQKVSQNVQVKQQIPLKLASNLSSSGPSHLAVGGATQLLPLKLSQDDKSRRTNSAGYHRLCPPPGETIAVMNHFHNRTGSSPAIMDVNQIENVQSTQYPVQSTSTHKKSDDEEVIYF